MGLWSETVCILVVNLAVSRLAVRLSVAADTLTNGSSLVAQLDASGAQDSINLRLDTLTSSIDYCRTRLYAYEQPVALSGETVLQIVNTQAGLSGLHNSMSLDFKVAQKARWVFVAHTFTFTLHNGAWYTRVFWQYQESFYTLYKVLWACMKFDGNLWHGIWWLFSFAACNVHCSWLIRLFQYVPKVFGRVIAQLNSTFMGHFIFFA